MFVIGYLLIVACHLLFDLELIGKLNTMFSPADFSGWAWFWIGFLLVIFIQGNYGNAMILEDIQKKVKK